MKNSKILMISLTVIVIVIVTALLISSQIIHDTNKTIYAELMHSSRPHESTLITISDSTQIISNQTVIENQTKVFGINITVGSGGVLLIKNSQIILNSKENEHVGIIVQNNGTLKIVNSTIQAANPLYRYFLKVEYGAYFSLLESNIFDAGYLWTNTGEYAGLWINTENATIENSTFMNNYYGIAVWMSKNVTVYNCTFSNNEEAFFVSDSSEVYISNNTFINNDVGLTISYSYNVHLENNTFENDGLWIFNSIDYYSLVYFNNNVINDQSIKLYVNVSNQKIGNLSEGILIFAFCENITVENVTTGGIEIYKSSNVTLTNANTSRTDYGIYVSNSYNLTISESQISNETYGIYLENVNSTEIQDCSITESTYGTYFGSSKNITLSNSIYSKNQIGIDLWNSTIISVERSMISDGETGISATISNNITITYQHLLHLTDIGVSLYDTYNVSFSNSYFEACNSSVYVSLSELVQISNVTVLNNDQRGIVLYNSTNIYLSQLSIFSSEIAVELINTNSTAITQSEINSSTIAGISLSLVSDLILCDSLFYENNISLSIADGLNITIENNSVSNSISYAFQLINSKNITILENRFIGKSENVYIGESSSIEISSNVLRASITSSSQFIVSNSSTIEFRKNNFTYVSIQLSLVSDVILNENSILSNNQTILSIQNSSILLIEKNVFKNGHTTISLDTSEHFTIFNNVLTNFSTYAIFAARSINGSIKQNSIQESTIAIYLSSTNNVNLCNNTIAFNSEVGILLLDSDNITIFLNNIYGNKIGLQIWHNITSYTINKNYTLYVYYNNFANLQYNLYDNIECYLDNGSIGNFWSTYNGPDLNNDDIGDLPYLVDADSIDRYPLMYPIELIHDTIAPNILNVSINPKSPTVYDPVTVYANVSDNVFIGKVILMYYYNGEWLNRTMLYDITMHLYVAVIPATENVTTVNFKIVCMDLSRNVAVSDVYQYVTQRPTGVYPPQIVITAFVLIILLLVIALVVIIVRARRHITAEMKRAEEIKKAEKELKMKKEELAQQESPNKNSIASIDKDNSAT